MKFRKHFDYDVRVASDEVAIDFTGEESLTVQSMAEDADLNVLMDRFGITGRMPSNPRVPSYGDFTGIVDFQSALNAVGAAMDSFMELPAKIRSRFDNDPQKLLAFCADDANIEEAQRLGLLREKEIDKRGSGEGSGSVAAVSGSSSEAGGTKPGDSSGQPVVTGGSPKASG